jgi:prepilin signal peptidase PulO-like enzyme (type II secretory pathway)
MTDIYIANIFSVGVAILGLIIGSFLNCLIWRLYKNETLGGRSYCPQCRQTIAWYDNIPLLSFILLGGRCRHCRGRISWQYPLVELLTAVLFFLTFRADMFSAHLTQLLLRDWLLVVTLIIVFVYDLRWRLVPMTIVWPMAVLMLVLNWSLGVAVPTLLLFGLLGTAFFWAQYVLTKKRGIGEGDIWLGLLLGLAFPDLGDLVLILLITYISGSVVGLFLISRQKKGWQSAIALGPFLALGAIITLIWGGPIIAWYLQLLN